MALKTDYKDDVFSGDRKYQEKDNSDGTISLVDKTAYSQKGDTFSAADINAINKAVNELSAVATTATWDNVSGKPATYPSTWDTVSGKPSTFAPTPSTIKSFTLTAASWSSGSYTISDSLITASSNQEVLPAIGITADQMKALQKANIIDSGQSEGSLTLKALGTVPSIDIPIRIIFRGTI